MKSNRHNFLRTVGITGSVSTLLPFLHAVIMLQKCNGEIDMLIGSGLGITIDPDYMATRKIFEN